MQTILQAVTSLAMNLNCIHKFSDIDLPSWSLLEIGIGKSISTLSKQIDSRRNEIILFGNTKKNIATKSFK